MKKIYQHKIKPRLDLLIKYFTINTENSVPEKDFIKKLSRYKINWNSRNKNIVISPIIEDYTMCIKLAAAAHCLASKTDSNIGLFSVGTKIEDTLYQGDTPFRDKLTEKFYTVLDNVFLSFGGKVVHRNLYSHPDSHKIEVAFQRIKKGINSKEDVLKIEIDGILMGDLIYDTYLRFRSKATLNIQDDFLDKIIIEALHIYYNCKELLTKYNVKALIGVYATYTKHGVIVRLCLKNNIPVYTIGGLSPIHRVSREYPSHSNNHFLFPKIFNLLSNKQALIKESAFAFEKRFEGVKDGATFYMKQSAFNAESNPELNSIDWENTVVVLAHCFFDSPHIYRDLLFPDFYVWMNFTLDELCKQSRVNVVVKQHPNGVNGNDEIFEELKAKYKGKNITFIDKKTSQRQIMQNKPKAIITAYGTAASEFSYMGFPVLTIYDNPFTAYDFTHVARTKEEYSNLLSRILDLEPKQNKDQVAEYYYMQHSFYLQGRDYDYLKFSEHYYDSFSDKFLLEFLPKMDEAYFKELYDSITEGLELTEWEEKALKLD